MLQQKKAKDNQNMIPFVDLNAQYQNIREDIDEAIRNCINRGTFINGKIVTEFENKFASYIGTKYCVGCGNGTDALEIILHSLGIGPGDEVIVPALSWIATAECVNNVGAEPVFVDINPLDYNIDYNRIEEKISSYTKAIIPVHLYGGPSEMTEIMRIAEKHSLYVVEDCAQAHGAEYYGQKAGSFGVASAFSFFPSKNLGAFGDAGAIITNDLNLAERARMISNHGQLKVKHSHFLVGRNSRLDTLQASILDVKLRHLDEWNESRRQAASYYRSGLNDIKEIVLPADIPYNKHVFHLFVIQCNRRNELIELFEKNNISFGIHYPKAMPFFEAYSYKNLSEKEFPVVSQLTDKIISLPIYPEISEKQIDMVCKVLHELD
jgi:dTDP-4-amino-4,6-dideoxygalactose transaminase